MSPAGQEWMAARVRLCMVLEPFSDEGVTPLQGRTLDPAQLNVPAQLTVPAQVNKTDNDTDAGQSGTAQDDIGGRRPDCCGLARPIPSAPDAATCAEGMRQMQGALQLCLSADSEESLSLCAAPPDEGESADLRTRNPTQLPPLHAGESACAKQGGDGENNAGGVPPSDTEVDWPGMSQLRSGESAGTKQGVEGRKAAGGVSHCNGNINGPDGAALDCGVSVQNPPRDEGENHTGRIFPSDAEVDSPAVSVLKCGVPAETEQGGEDGTDAGGVPPPNPVVDGRGLSGVAPQSGESPSGSGYPGSDADQESSSSSEPLSSSWRVSRCLSLSSGSEDEVTPRKRPRGVPAGGWERNRVRTGESRGAGPTGRSGGVGSIAPASRVQEVRGLLKGVCG
jgi:hypothetical protein